MQVPSFFGGESDVSYDELQRRKRIAQQLLSGSDGNIRNVGEGINSATGMIVGALTNKRAEKEEARQRERFNNQLISMAGPSAANISQMSGSPYANAAQKKIIAALADGVPQYQNGTPFARGGVSLVGEQGPELVNLPRGAQVMPAQNPPVPQEIMAAAGNAEIMGQEGADQIGSDPLSVVGDQFSTDDNVIIRDIEKREIGQRNAVNALQMILSELEANPNLLDDAHTMKGKAATGLLAFRDRTGIDAIDINPEQEKRVGDVAAYRQKLLTNVNEYIKEITGATVGQGDETTRLMAVQANEDDGPSQIVAKLKGGIEMGMLNTARFNHMKNSGGGDAPTDREMRQILSERGKSYYDEALASGMADAEARMQAAERLSEEYGI